MFKQLSHRPGQLHGTSFIDVLIRLFLFSFVIFILFSRVVSDGISHDEYQFVASSQLLVMKGQIPYLDYPFLHMPYQILINSIAVLLSSYHFFAIRCLNSLFFLISILIVFFQITRLFKDHSTIALNLAGTLAIMLFLFDPSMLNVGGRALNHAFPVMLSLLAYVTFQNWTTKKQRVFDIFCCGFLAGLATGTRLSFAVLIIPPMFVLAFYPNLQSRTIRLKLLSILMLGFCLSLLPVILLMIKAPTQFFFGNYVYIKLNTIYRQEVNFQSSMTLVSKIEYFIKNVLTHPGSFVIYLGLCLASLSLFPKLTRRNNADCLMLFLSVLISFVLLGSGFAPTPLWPQYFFAPLPFIVISFFIWLSGISKILFHRLLMTGIIAVIIIGFPLQLTAQQIAVLRNPAKWVPIQTHNFAQKVQKIVKQGKVVTLAPIYPLEAGLETYPTFIVGPFVWRTAPLLSEEGREKYNIASFHELEGMLDVDPPGAFITGLETDYGFDAYSAGLLEKPFIDYANEHDYKPYEMLKSEFWPHVITIWVKH